MRYAKLDSERMAELSDLASDYADDYCAGDFLVDPHRIADGVGLSYSYNDYLGHFEGLLEYRNRSFWVYLHLNAKEHSDIPRVRFSFAHELGHYLIDSQRRLMKQPAFPGSTAFKLGSIEEQEANYFAACLLMPKERFRRFICGQDFSPSLISQIQNTFNVSFPAAVQRYIELGSHPVMLVCSRNRFYKWKKVHVHFPYEALKGYYWEHLAKETMAGRYFVSGRKSRRTERVFARDWFKMNGNRDTNSLVNEYCVYYPKDKQAMSLIRED